MKKGKFPQWTEHDSCKLGQSNWSQFYSLLCLYKRLTLHLLSVCNLSMTWFLWLAQTPKSHVTSSLCPVTTCCGWAILFVNNQALQNLCKLLTLIKNLWCKQQTEDKLKSSILASVVCGIMLGVWKMHSKIILFFL